MFGETAWLFNHGMEGLFQSIRGLNKLRKAKGLRLKVYSRL